MATTTTLNNFISSTQNTNTTQCWAYLFHIAGLFWDVNSPMGFNRNATTNNVSKATPSNLPVYVRALEMHL